MAKKKDISQTDINDALGGLDAANIESQSNDIVTGKKEQNKDSAKVGRPSHLIDAKGNKIPSQQFTARMTKPTYRKITLAVMDGYARTKSELIEIAVIEYLKNKV